jgi:hydrogenase small subunit
MYKLVWVQAGACSGDTMAFLSSDSPNMVDFINSNNIEILFHPSLTTTTYDYLIYLAEQVKNGDMFLDILCVEGALIFGPENTGRYDSIKGIPKKNIIKDLTENTGVVFAVGTCASFGGIPASGVNTTSATGLQFFGDEKEGPFPPDWKSKWGLPIVNLPGCPVHPYILMGAIKSVILEKKLELDEYNRPKEYYSTIIHQGCSRNEYYEYNIEEEEFGERGCLFFYLGCQGPYTFGVCNTVLWNGTSSKTRAGVPCIGCTSPDFPIEEQFFKTEHFEGIPVKLPIGVKRANYLAYKGLARTAAPQRLLKKVKK